MFLRWLARRLAVYLTQRVHQYAVSTARFQALSMALRPGDVLLVEGDTRISVAIRYLTQSTWSHAALYLGPEAGLPEDQHGEPHVLVEADIQDGIRSVPLTEYRHCHTRICRPASLSEADVGLLTAYAMSRLGDAYDLRNVIDLARYLCPTPPVPLRYRRRMLTLGSGDPTRAICSTFIAQAFQQIRYPILPLRIDLKHDDPRRIHWEGELYQIRHHSLFVPRDFDASPYFSIIKPTLESGFDHQAMKWVSHPNEVSSSNRLVR